MNTLNKLELVLQGIGIAVIHFVTTFMLGFATGVGTLKGPWVIINKTLTFPLSLFSGPDNPLLGWLGWIVLSLVWGFAIAYFLQRRS